MAVFKKQEKAPTEHKPLVDSVVLLKGSSYGAYNPPSH